MVTPRPYGSPLHFRSNCGGDFLEVIVGFNHVVQRGAPAGDRLALEYAVPAFTQLIGVGMKCEDALTAGWQCAF